MNSKEKYIDEKLREYVGPRTGVKAPEGFTSKVMNMVQMTPVPKKSVTRSRNISLVPYISAAITLILILVAVVLRGYDANSATSTLFTNLLKNINVSLPEIDLSVLLKIRLPEFMTYVFIGLFILAIFDRGLNRLFHRGKSQ